MSNIQVVVSGTGWMGSGIGSIESATEELIEGARNEILLTAYTIGNADRIFDLLERALTRGVKVCMLVNRFRTQFTSVQEKLKKMQDKYHYFFLYSFDADEDQGALHAKVIIADRKKALVGSSNLSYSGMILNHELALLVSGREVAEAARAIDLLLISKYCTQVK